MATFKPKNIVITGGTRGIGFCMANEFLRHGNNVTISGTSVETLKNALSKFEEYGNRVQGTICNVTKFEDVKRFWDFAVEKWGIVDIWINNAGINQPYCAIWDLSENRAEEIIATNITGMIYGSQVAMRAMIVQGHGAIYDMEGLGSNGGHMNNLNVYGTSKCALRYFTRGMIGEAKPYNVIVGTLSPGMMVTDFVVKPLMQDKARFEKSKKMINLIADKPEKVAVFLVKKMLANKKNGAHFAWFTTARFFGRMIKSIFVKRDLFSSVTCLPPGRPIDHY